jgi:hypothetical protein
MLVEQAVVGWLEAKFMECVAADPSKFTLTQASFRLKRLESAQKRYQAALKLLITMRTQMPNGLAPAGSVKLHEEPERKRASGV